MPGRFRLARRISQRDCQTQAWLGESLTYYNLELLQAIHFALFGDTMKLPRVFLLAGVLALAPTMAQAAPPPLQLLSLGKCLSSLDNGGSDHTPAVLASCKGLDGQNWQVPPRGFSGPIVGKAGKCLDVTGNNPADRTPVILFSCLGLPHQTWRHELDGRIVGLAGKCLDVLASGTDDGTQLVLYRCNATPNQLWKPRQLNTFHPEGLLSGSRISDLAASPVLPNRIFAATAESGVLRSENGGADWANAGQGLDYYGSGVAVDPLRPDYVYALSSGGLYLSSDGGRHFLKSPAQPAAGVSGIALDPFKTDHLLAHDTLQIFESFDGGQSFTQRNFPLQLIASTVQQVLFDPLVPGRWWIASDTQCSFCFPLDEGVFRSDNSGESWTRVTTEPTTRIVADPHATGHLYTTSFDKVYRSTDAGNSWQLLATFAGSTIDVWVDSAFPGQIVVAHVEGISRSVDGGASFLPVALDLRRRATGAPAERVSRLLYSGDRLLAAINAGDSYLSRGVISSTDFGATWSQQSSHGFAAEDIVDIQTFDAGDRLQVWAIGTDGVYLSDDGGVRYHRSLAIADPSHATSLLIDPYDPSGQTVYVAGTTGYFQSTTGPYLWKTSNGGATWQVLASSNGSFVETGHLIATAVGGKHIYLTTLSGYLFRGDIRHEGILRSEDDGASWTPIQLGRQVNQLANGPGNVLYASSNPLLRSFDGGKTWQLVDGFSFFLTTYGNELFLATDETFERTTYVGGAIETYRLPAAIKRPTAILATADKIYLGDSEGGVFSSSDRGRSWTAIDLGLPRREIRALQVDARDAGHLFAGTQGRGLYQAVVSPGEAPLRFAGGRFTATITWRDFQGVTGSGKAAAWTEDSGSYWFFQPENVEVMVKVLDARHINGNYWVFVGSLSNVEFTLTVRDEWTGSEKVYHNPSGNFASFGDIGAFPFEGVALGLEAPLQTEPSFVAKAAGEATGLLTNEPTIRVGDRFDISVTWEDGLGYQGIGSGSSMTGDTAAFSFFSGANTELIIKVLDGRGINGHFWVFYGALSDVGYVISIRDTWTGEQKTYRNPLGTFASVGDIRAF